MNVQIFSKRAAKAFFLGLTVIFAGSCASIREVKKTPGKGGEIMVSEGIGGDARADAKQVMKENCGSKSPVIIEEGEAVVGSSYRGDNNKHSLFSTGESEDKREWRIKYKCKKKK
jgi:hypothetical protein